MSCLWRNTNSLFIFLTYTALILWFILLVFIIPFFKALEWLNREPHDTRMYQLALRRLDHMRRMGNYSEEFFVWMEGSLARVAEEGFLEKGR
jgi:hypothetical protein